MTTQHIRLAQIASISIEFCYAAALAIAAGLFAQNHWLTVTAPVPLDIYEGTMPQITGLIAQGHNPYTFEFQPEAADLYPPLYNLIVAPMSLLFGNTLLLHRVVSAVFILLSCALVAISARYAGARRVDSAGAAILTYGALIFYSTPLASTNAMGEFLFLMSVLWPWLKGYNARSLAVSVACGVLAFYTKQYFLLSLGLVCVYLFLFVSKTRAAIYGGVGVGVLALSLCAVHIASPYFLDNTFFAVRTVTSMFSSGDFMLRQLSVFCAIYPGFMLTALVCAGGTLLHWRKRNVSWVDALRPTILPFNAPLLRKQIPHPWVNFIGTTAAIVISLGQNPGNFMTYLFQLMTPFLLLGVFSLGEIRGRWRILVLPLLCFSLVGAYDILPKDFDFDRRGWDRISEVIAPHHDILASPILVMPLVEQRKHVYFGGHTGFFRLAAWRMPYFEHAVPSHRVWPMWDAYMANLNDGVRSRRFDVILLVNPLARNMVDQQGAEYVRQHYVRTEQIPISFTDRPGGGDFIIQVWRPRPDVLTRTAE